MNLVRVLLAAAALSVIAPGLPAGEPAVRLTVGPAAAPRPALKYQLLPEVREMTPGNPVQWYMRCFAEQRNFFFGKEANAERARFLTAPLAELTNLRGYGGFALSQADWGARLDTPDWQVLERVLSDGPDLHLPELGPMRILATGLRVRFRIEVAGRHFDDAIRTAKTMFAFARHLGENPTTAANRLGLTTAGLALDALEEMLQQPGCPNLYWALTDLPGPLVDLRKGLQGDRALVDTELRRLRDDAAMTEEQLEELVSRLSGRAGFAREQAGQPPHNFRAGLTARVSDAARVKVARMRLLEPGGPGDLRRGLSALGIISCSALQLILLDEKREYELRRDEAMKLLALAPWQIDALPPGPDAGRGDGLFADLLPNVAELRQAQGRLEQRVALLRHVEALRMYAADHDGRLPATLADAGVPLPPDPFTGKPFAYEVAGTTARLRGEGPASPVRYEVTVRK
jgi:hypothetical protein